ncbi:MAG TPA: ChaN family lipoprotein [Flavobacterium sp.]|nr:ChaN family lipoprotein [Flavobacterium sp.]
MQKKFSFFIVIAGVVYSTMLSAQDKVPYKIYNRNGKSVTYTEMVKAASASDIVLFGEQHDNSLIHWLQLSLTKDLHATKQLVLGAEMVEADNQAALNRYLSGEISQKSLDTLARLWPNHKTDYKPLVDFAKDNKIPFVATNVPRRFASLVYKKGFEALDDVTSEERQWIAPLPIAYDKSLPGYVKIVEEMGGHGGENLPKAQALKDATMAHFIITNFKVGTTFVHFNGSYHSDNFEGIYHYLKNVQPAMKVLTIATTSEKNITVFPKDHLNKADFIIITDHDITKTH